ncbi:MAG: transcriptional repressor [Nitrospinota bacterium]|nr:MAG: transcriptional repressor [Nitrospinota bacterium]
MGVPGARQPGDQDLRKRLRDAGLRVTLLRLQVLAALIEQRGHWSVDEVFHTLRTRGVELSRASVYNAMNDFMRTGLVRIADTGPGRALYEVAQDQHHHFVCRQCGAIIDVPCIVGDPPCLQADLPGCTIDQAQVIFRGQCPNCQNTPEAL